MNRQNVKWWNRLLGEKLGSEKGQQALLLIPQTTQKEQQTIKKISPSGVKPHPMNEGEQEKEGYKRSMGFYTTIL